MHSFLKSSSFFHNLSRPVSVYPPLHPFSFLLIPIQAHQGSICTIILIKLRNNTLSFCFEMHINLTCRFSAELKAEAALLKVTHVSSALMFNKPQIYWQNFSECFPLTCYQKPFPKSCPRDSFRTGRTWRSIGQVRFSEGLLTFKNRLSWNYHFGVTKIIVSLWLHSLRTLSLSFSISTFSLLNHRHTCFQTVRRLEMFH